MISTKALRLTALASILILSLSFYSAVSFSLEKGKGKIEGRVVNVTSGTNINESTDIIFYQYLKDKQVGRSESQTDSKGNFQIKDLLAEENYEYFITAVYKGVEYQAGPLIFEEENTISNVEIPVYEPTFDSSVLSVGMHHILINITEEALRVEEYILFENGSDRTYVGERKFEDKNVVAEFVLPEGFKELNLLSGLMSCCVISTEKGFIDTMPIKPGAKEVAFSYTIPYSRNTHQFAIPIQFATKNFSFLISKVEGVRAVSENLQSEEDITIKNRTYSIYSGKNIPPKTKIQLKLVGLPEKNQTLIFVLVGVIGTLIGGGVVFPLLAKRNSLPDLMKKKVSIGKQRYLELLKKELLLDIAHLDAKLSRKEISSENYEKLREEKKKKLIDITYKLENVKRK